MKQKIETEVDINKTVFEIGVERDCNPIYLNPQQPPFNVKCTTPDYFIKVFGVKILISEDDYKNIISKMYKTRK